MGSPKKGAEILYSLFFFLLGGCLLMIKFSIFVDVAPF